MFLFPLSLAVLFIYTGTSSSSTVSPLPPKKTLKNVDTAEDMMKAQKLVSYIYKNIDKFTPNNSNPYYDYLPNQKSDAYYQSKCFYNIALDFCNDSVLEGFSGEEIPEDIKEQKGDVTISFKNMSGQYTSALSLVIQSLGCSNDSHRRILRDQILVCTGQERALLLNQLDEKEGAFYLKEPVCLAAFLYTIIGVSSKEEFVQMISLNRMASDLGDINAPFFLYHHYLDRKKSYKALKYLLNAALNGHPSAIEMLKLYVAKGYPIALIPSLKQKPSPVAVSDALSDTSLEDQQSQQQQEQEEGQRNVNPLSQDNIIEYIASFFF